jgi:hypothetical protein
MQIEWSLFLAMRAACIETEIRSASHLKLLVQLRRREQRHTTKKSPRIQFELLRYGGPKDDVTINLALISGTNQPTPIRNHAE